MSNLFLLEPFATLGRENPVATHEHQCIMPDSELRWQQWTNRAILNDKGEVVEFQGTGRDITKRKRAEEQRDKTEIRLRQAQKMEAVGQLAGGVAHDFNNLLQVIQGYTDMALEDVEADSPAYAELKEVMKAAKRATTLISQLLAFSRRQVLELAYLDLNEVIADMMRMLRRVIGEHITLEVISGRDLGTVRADRGQIEQILVNLCVNAHDAMPMGGEITIETENVRIDEKFCESHPWAKPGRYILLSVTDTGCGMDKETLARVFEPFFTTKGIGKGTGLGLSTVYGLVNQHGGMVHVYSEIDKGTTFKIYLILAERAATAVGHKIEGPIQGGTETILLAEDDIGVRNLSQIILEKAGYTVLTAVDGEEALSVFKNHADEIDLALLDVIMPKLGGRAVFNHIREQRPDIRILFCSGYSMNAVHTDFILDKGLQLIQKPYQRNDLLRRVRDALDAYI
ncbi:MAG: ATP-binding protein [Thermodesulfobacteriota bacterium]|nr:ATP-binding protein [Thermodesulfobacteriota bacterium]